MVPYKLKIAYQNEHKSVNIYVSWKEIFDKMHLCNIFLVNFYAFYNFESLQVNFNYF